MPELCRFREASIRMWPQDHGVPHFRVRHGGKSASYRIEPFEVLEGALDKAIHKAVSEWAALHKQELMAAWNTLRSGQTPDRIDPLP